MNQVFLSRYLVDDQSIGRWLVEARSSGVDLMLDYLSNQRLALLGQCFPDTCQLVDCWSRRDWSMIVR